MMTGSMVTNHGGDATLKFKRTIGKGSAIAGGFKRLSFELDVDEL